MRCTTARATLLLALLAFGCESTRPEIDEAKGGQVTIPPDDLRPIRLFNFETRRVLAADFIRIEASRQLFETQMGISRDPRYVDRVPTEIDADGNKVIILRNNSTQTTNVDPDLLPRVYFGTNGLQLRAYQEIRIYLKEPRNRDRPIYIRVQARNVSGNVKMWVTGRLQHEKPRLTIESALLWNEERERYVHRSSIG